MPPCGLLHRVIPQTLMSLKVILAPNTKVTRTLDKVPRKLELGTSRGQPILSKLLCDKRQELSLACWLTNSLLCTAKGWSMALPPQCGAPSS